MDNKYVSDDVREALVLTEEELKPKYPRIPAGGKQMRKLWRGIAHRRIKEKGFTRINKKRGEKNKSFFAYNWQRYCY